MKKERRFIQSEVPARNDPSPDQQGSCARCERMASDDARDVEMLRELAALGMDMARAVQGQVMDQIAAGKQPSANNILGGGDPGLAFSRIAKTVRQAIALKRKIAEEADARQHRTAEQQAAHRAKQAQEADWAESDRRHDRGDRIERGVVRLIDSAPNAGNGDYENLLEDIYDKMDDFEADGEFNRSTTEALIARIAVELGYVPPANDDDDHDDDETEEPETAEVEAEPAAVEDDPPDRSLYPERKGRYPPS